MGSYGFDFANDFGGGPGPQEKMLAALRSMLGAGGISVDDDGLDALELQCDAQMLAAIAAFDERVALQIFPNLAIDHIPSFEDILGIFPGTEDDEQRREEITIEWTTRNTAVIPTLLQRLQKIDPRISILDHAWAESKVTGPGMPFYPYVLASWMNPPNYSQLPLYSSRSEFYVLLDLGAQGAIPEQSDLDVIERVKRLLKIVLPACDIPYIITENGGLIAGVSPVGYAGVSGS